jgi:hypothetical protein
MKTLYITHYSRDKLEGIRETGQAVTPDRLYASPALIKFVDFCKRTQLNWAIFSDKYGVVFPEEKISWYSKPPDSVTEREFEQLLENFTTRLAGFDEIYFYQRTGETHLVFKEIERLGRERGLNIIEFLEEKIT